MKRSVTVGSGLGQLPIPFWRLPSCVLKSKFPLPLSLLLAAVVKKMAFRL